MKLPRFEFFWARHRIQITEEHGSTADRFVSAGVSGKVSPLSYCDNRFRFRSRFRECAGDGIFETRTRSGTSGRRQVHRQEWPGHRIGE